MISKTRILEDISGTLLVLLHGRAGNLNSMWGFERLFPENCNIISFEAPIDDPDDGGKSWWLLNDPLLESAEFAATQLEVQISLKLIELELKPNKIILIGFSQGAALSSVLVQRNSLVGSSPKYDAAALLCGFVPEFKPLEISAKFFIFHGTEDQIITFDRAERARDFLANHGAKVNFFSEAVGHKIGVKAGKELKSWLISVV